MQKSFIFVNENLKMNIGKIKIIVKFIVIKQESIEVLRIAYVI